MNISLVIPAYNEEVAIGGCLESALKNGAGKFKEIIVVDNASSDHTDGIVRSYPGVTLLQEARKGTGHARQTGFEHATGDLVAFVDADNRIPLGWVERIEREFLNDKKLVLFSGPYRYYGTRLYRRWLLNTFWVLTYPAYLTVGYLANSGNLVVRRDAFARIGGHDRSIDFYGDDTDVARRLHKVGKTMFRLNFYVYSSARRFDARGILHSDVLYVLNFFWQVLFSRPYSRTHEDIRTSSS